MAYLLRSVKQLAPNRWKVLIDAPTGGQISVTWQREADQEEMVAKARAMVARLSNDYMGDHSNKGIWNTPINRLKAALRAKGYDQSKPE